MKYTVHRALSLIKSTKSRIEKEFSEDAPAWIRVARGQEDSIRGVSVEEIRREIQSHYDRVTTLIENYIALKSAVVQSNAGVLPGTELRKVSVGGKKLTVAEIIELRDTVYAVPKSNLLSRTGDTNHSNKRGFKATLLSKMKQDFFQAQREFDDMQKKADEEINRYLQSINSRSDDEQDSKTKSIVEATSKMLHEQKDPRLIDPLKLLNKITTLDNEIEEFLTEADSVLSEQNALTTIELNLAEIK